jgi:hypothetical protein
VSIAFVDRAGTPVSQSAQVAAVPRNDRDSCDTRFGDYLVLEIADAELEGDALKEAG